MSIVEVTIGGMAIGAGKQLAELGYRSLAKWFSSELTEAARARAECNVADLLVRVEARVTNIESSPYGPESLKQCFEHPSFHVLLQKAMINAGQTDSRRKHDLLARLITDRLLGDAESTLALASQRACDAIASLSKDQMGFLSASASLLVDTPAHDFASQEEAKKSFAQFHSIILQALSSGFSALDLLHLAAIGCVSQQQMVANGTEGLLKKWKWDGASLSAEAAGQVESYKIFEKARARLSMFPLTSVGLLVGIYVRDLEQGRETDLSRWEELVAKSGNMGLRLA